MKYYAFFHLLMHSDKILRKYDASTAKTFLQTLGLQTQDLNTNLLFVTTTNSPHPLQC